MPYRQTDRQTDVLILDALWITCRTLGNLESFLYFLTYKISALTEAADQRGDFFEDISTLPGECERWEAALLQCSHGAGAGHGI